MAVTLFIQIPTHFTVATAASLWACDSKSMTILKNVTPAAQGVLNNNYKKQCKILPKCQPIR